MTNVKSLLEMYVKMGGSLTDTYSDIAGGVPVGQYSTISDAILACSKKYSSGGGGGAEKFVVTLTEENDTWTADKTVAEIIEAYEDGQIVEAMFNDEIGISVVLSVVGEQSNEHQRSVLFSALLSLEAASYYSAIGFSDGTNDQWIVTVENIGLPSYSSSNNGKVLGVDDGDLAWVDSTAPLIVTLTADGSTGNLVGNKTYKEVYDAVDGGQTVTLKGNTGSITFATNALSVGLGNDGYSVALVFGGSITEARGAANEYVMFTMN